MVVSEFQQDSLPAALLLTIAPQQAAPNREGLLRSKGGALQAELRSIAITEFRQSAGQLKALLLRHTLAGDRPAGLTQ